MKKSYIIWLFFLLTGCQTAKQATHNSGLQCLKLLHAQLLQNNISGKPNANNDFIVSQILPQQIAMGHGLMFSAPSSIIQPRLKQLLFAPYLSRTKHVTILKPQVAPKPKSSKPAKNPFVIPLLIFLSVTLIFIVPFGVYAGVLGLGAIGGIFFLICMILAMIILLVFAISTRSENFENAKNTGYFLTWLLSLLTLPFPLIMSTGTLVVLLLPTALLAITAVIYFILWFNNLKEKPFKKKEQKKDLIMQIMFLLGWIASLVFVIASLYANPLILALSLILLATFFFLWLWKLKPRARETVYFLCFILFLLLFLGFLPPGGAGIEFIYYLAICLGFIFMWIKHLHDWKKPELHTEPVSK
jgi:hypothetical protein